MSGPATHTRANRPPKTAPSVRYNEKVLLDAVEGAVTTEADDGVGVGDGDGDGVGVGPVEAPATTAAMIGKVASCTALAAKSWRKWVVAKPEYTLVSSALNSVLAKPAELSR